MQIRRPLAALLTALALFGGGATLTGCGDWGPSTPNEGVDEGGGGDNPDNDPAGDEEDLPDNTDPERDIDDDTTDPD